MLHPGHSEKKVGIRVLLGVPALHCHSTSYGPQPSTGSLAELARSLARYVGGAAAAQRDLMPACSGAPKSQRSEACRTMAEACGLAYALSMRVPRRPKPGAVVRPSPSPRSTQPETATRAAAWAGSGSWLESPRVKQGSWPSSAADESAAATNASMERRSQASPLRWSKWRRSGLGYAP